MTRSSGDRPRRLVVIAGTGTDVGKTWVAARVLADLRRGGVTVSARKPAQSFDPRCMPGETDAAVLGTASGEAPEDVCPPHRSYEVAMAPPMAAAQLGRPLLLGGELLAGMAWPAGIEVGVVETAGGVRSPLAEDADAVDLVAGLRPDLVVLVAEAGLGTINVVRLSADALAAVGYDPVVVLNRFDDADGLHLANADWLARRCGLRVLTVPGGLADLVAMAAG